MKHRILLVEDDVMVGPVIKEMLNHGGYDVVLTRDLADTMRLPDFDFSAVISDLKLIASDGCEVIAFMRSKKPGIPALLMSGFGPHVANSCAQRGIPDVGFLPKPFSPPTLLTAAAALVAKTGP